MRALLIPFTLAMLAGCGGEDVSVLDGMNKARGTAAYLGYCERPVSCDEPGGVCARIHGHKGASCLRRAASVGENAAPAEMRRLAALAEREFAASARLGGAAEALTAQGGRAEALELRRSFSPTADAPAVNAELEAAAGVLATLPDGAALAGYYRAGVVENRVLAAQPARSQCAEVTAALAMLPGAAPDPELAARVQRRRAALTAALRQPARSCG